MATDQSAQPCGCDPGANWICEQHKKSRRAWIGVDLDGVLAHDCATPEDVWTIGEPIPAMVAQVKAWLAEGQEVRIFTARVAMCGETSSIACDDLEFATYQRELITKWCQEVFGQVLPITATKDFQMIRYYDDRGVQMITNTGRSLAESYQAHLDKIVELIHEVD